MEKETIKIKCIAIDDEPLALQQMEAFINKVKFLELVKTFDNGFDALNFIKISKIDLVFLDVEMDDFTGIQLLEVLDNKPIVILTTAYAEYALKGYELEVTDYLLKPISYQRFLKSVSRVYDKFNRTNVSHQKVSMDSSPDVKEFMFVKTKHQLEKVFFKDILYLEGMSNYLIIKQENTKIYTLMSFKEITKLLPENNFARVHKSYIVALDKVERITKNHIHIGDKNIPIGQTYKLSFYEELEKRNMM